MKCDRRINMRIFFRSPLVVAGKGLKLTRNRLSTCERLRVKFPGPTANFGRRQADAAPNRLRPGAREPREGPMTFQISHRGKEYLKTAETLLRAAQTMTDGAFPHAGNSR